MYPSIVAVINKIHWCVAIFEINGSRRLALQITKWSKLMTTLHQSATYCRKSRFWPASPAFDDPVGGGVRSEYCRDVWYRKLEWWCGYTRGEKIEDMITRLDKIHERDTQMDGRTHGQTPHDGIYRPRLCKHRAGTTHGCRIPSPKHQSKQIIAFSTMLMNLHPEPVKFLIIRRP